MSDVNFASLREAREAVRALSDRTTPPRLKSGVWTISQVLLHCGQSIECSLHGFPEHKARWIQKTVGRLVLRRFLSAGRMNHNKNGPIPGLSLPTDRELKEAVSMLTSAIDSFLAWPNEPAPHFIYGATSKDEYDKIHAMHIADHLRDLSD